ncbi:MAG TPA: dihydroorotase family protein [bacterium]|nr:dihydroorotase family protein [bacterium]
MSDLLIRNVRLPDGSAGSVRVHDGRIAALGPAVQATPEVPVLEGGGRLVLPGAIDMHVHFRQPGGEHKETLLSGARAAVKGGTTTCADMPNTSPRTTTLAALEAKVALAAGAPANLLFNFGAEPDNADEVRRAAAHPAVKALKIYMGPSTGQGGLPPDDVQAHFRLAAELDLPVMVHAEDLERIEANAARHPHDAYHHHLLRSSEGELAAVRQALDWAREYGVRLYLAHCTVPGAIRLAEESGIRERVFVEVCPHHLLLSVESIAPPVENRYKVNPPLRTEAERAELYACLGKGIDGLGSDHAPHTLAEKEQPYDQAPSGIPGVEYLFPLALDWWRRDAISLERLIALTSGNAARWFGMPKGAVAVGADADLVLMRPDAEWTIAEGDDQVASQCGWTVYGGRHLRGRPEVTLVSGRVVYDLKPVHP